MTMRATARVDRLDRAAVGQRRQAALPQSGRRQRDAGFVALAIAHAVALVFVPSIPLVAIGLWWNANTIAHNFIHRPFFKHPGANRLFAALLTLDLGVPTISGASAICGITPKRQADARGRSCRVRNSSPRAH
jgi:fatty acid desaturase